MSYNRQGLIKEAVLGRALHRGAGLVTNVLAGRPVRGAIPGISIASNTPNAIRTAATAAKGVADATTAIAAVGAGGALAHKAIKKALTRKARSATAGGRLLNMAEPTAKAIKEFGLPGAVLAGAAVHGVGRGGKAIADEVGMARSKMSLANYTPSLADEDPKMVNDYFNVVKAYSPAAARNPIVAGALVNKMIEFGGVDHNLVKGLVDIEKGRRSNEAPLNKSLLLGAVARNIESPLEG